MTQNIETIEKGATDWSKKIIVASEQTATEIPGRREFFQYLDLGLRNASDGKISANLVNVSRGLSEPTGWHYHVCDGQFAMILTGWVVLTFEDGTTRKISEGQFFFIEGGVRHNEIATSDTFSYLELFYPANMKTVACDAPEGWVDSDPIEIP